MKGQAMQLQSQLGQMHAHRSGAWDVTPPTIHNLLDRKVVRRPVNSTICAADVPRSQRQFLARTCRSVSSGSTGTIRKQYTFHSVIARGTAVPQEENVDQWSLQVPIADDPGSGYSKGIQGYSDRAFTASQQKFSTVDSDFSDDDEGGDIFSSADDQFSSDDQRTDDDAELPDRFDVSAEVERFIATGNLSPTVEEVSATFAFPLDRFQQQSIAAFLLGQSVVVCAPTGAGKTAIAEAAAAVVLARGQRVIYTTPLKALSNQKLFEMRARFGNYRVGLQTGDGSLNADSDVVIMTTEILRNIMYRTEEAGPGSREDRLANVGLVVLDEVHYLGDPDRGSVWEETIINCPRHIQLLAMSATVANPDDLGGWISQVHMKCQTIVTHFRPVPLTWQFCWDTESSGTQMVQLMGKKGRTLNPALAPPPPPNDFEWNRGSKKRGRKQQYEDLVEEEAAVVQVAERRRVPEMESAVALLQERGLLPAIWFIFSRKGCETAAASMGRTGLLLTSEAEREAIQFELSALVLDQPEAVQQDLVPALLAGAAAHHAGCLPAWKSLIERCFQRGLLKVVFATDTLAAGINMPARTTVVSVLSRRQDAGHKLLTHNQLLQMAGRAGRRGYDTAGHCVILQSRFEQPQVAAKIISGGPESLQSQFSTGYSMALNLLHTRTLPEARDFLDRSFGNYLGGEGNQRKVMEAENMESKAAQLEAQLASTLSEDHGQLAQYTKLTERLKAERRSLKILRGAAIEERGQRTAVLLASSALPRAVGLEFSGEDTDGFNMLPATVVQRLMPPPHVLALDPDTPAFYLCLGANNSLAMVTGRHIVGLMADGLGNGEGGKAAATIIAAAESLDWNSWYSQAGGAQIAPGTAATAGLAARIPPAAAIDIVPLDPALEDAADEQRAVVFQVKGQMTLLKRGGRVRKALLAVQQTESEVERLQRGATALREKLGSGRSQSSWRAFENVTKVLVDAGALVEGTLAARPLGQVARQINGANELWLALALTSEPLQQLTAPQLAAVLSSLVAPDTISRPQMWCRYPPSEVVEAVVGQLEEQRTFLEELQYGAGVEASLAVDLRLSGLVEAWVGGGSWEQVTKDCSLDQGDTARLLSRTADLLRQVMHCSELLPDMRNAARRAAKSMDRPPISDLVQ